MTISSDPLAAEVDRAVEHVRAGGQVEDIESHTLDCKEQVGTVTKDVQRSAGDPQDGRALRYAVYDDSDRSVQLLAVSGSLR